MSTPDGQDWDAINAAITDALGTQASDASQAAADEAAKQWEGMGLTESENENEADMDWEVNDLLGQGGDNETDNDWQDNPDLGAADSDNAQEWPPSDWPQFDAQYIEAAPSQPETPETPAPGGNGSDPDVGPLSPDDQYAPVRPLHPAFMFKVSMGGQDFGEFQALEGFGKSIEPYSYQEGGRNTSPHMLLGAAKQTEITLKWGQIWREELFNWMEQVQVGKGFRRNIIVFHLDRDLTPLRIYSLKGAWPVKWSAPNLDAGSTAVTVESLTLVYERMYMRIPS